MNAISNGIRKRQNEAANIAKLMAADRLYGQTKRLNFLKFLFAVILPFLFSCVELFCQNGGQFVAVLPYLLSIASVLLSFLLKPTIDRKISLAADIKQDYDVSVYQMPWNRDIFGEKRDLTREIAENSAGQSGDAFRDWYRPEADAMPLSEGIFACQRENYAWDSGLRARYKNLCWCGVGTLILIILVVEIHKGESVAAFLASFAVFILPIVSWLLETVGALNADLKRLEEMKAAFQSANARNVKDLQKIQKALYEHRKSAVIPPGFLYRFFKSNDEEIARHTMEMENWGKKDATD